MASRVRTINFLPDVFRTPTNEQFLTATLDQLVSQPNYEKIQGYIGSKFGYGVNTTDSYVVESNKTRTDYQLEPAVVFTKPDSSTAKDVLTYPGLLDAINLQGGTTKNENALFSNEFYSWDSFVDLDKLINYTKYYWLPNGPDAVTVTAERYSTQSIFEFRSGATYRVTENGVVNNTDNPTITLVRGGTYSFVINQRTNFWIQTELGTSGVSSLNSSISTRDIYGVTDNGKDKGTIIFNVPLKGAEDEFKYAGKTKVDLVTTLGFNDIHGKPYLQLKEIDGISDLENKTILFYGQPTGTVGVINTLYDSTWYDRNIPDGYFDAGTYTNVNDYVYRVRFTGDKANPIVTLVEDQQLPSEQAITARLGNEYSLRRFVRNTFGEIVLLPVLTSDLDVLYYQDEYNPYKNGKIVLVDPENVVLDINDILGKTSYTSPNGITLTNGLKIQFTGKVTLEEYLGQQFYVEGVGRGIKLLNIRDFITPEPFGSITPYPFDMKAYDSEPYEIATSSPSDPDYIIINRASNNKNAWSRANRWFHEDVLKLSIEKNAKSPLSSAAYGNASSRAKRPIIEFYPNLKLFNSGTQSKKPVDFINNTVTDAFNEVNGQPIYYLDGTTPIFQGARMIFAGDLDANVRNKIYVADFVKLTPSSTPVISLSIADDGYVEPLDQTVVVNGQTFLGKSVYFTGTEWLLTQQKIIVNQQPRFDIFDRNGISFGDQTFYNGSDFTGCNLFEYIVGTGTNDPVLGFPIKYSSVSNLGDILFNVPLNTQTFNYVDNQISTTGYVKDGYVYDYDTRMDFTKHIGWQTAIGPSFQYQVLTFEYTDINKGKFTCDVPVITEDETPWKPIVVYVNNARQEPSKYTVVRNATTTDIILTDTYEAGTVVVLNVISNYKSNLGYYQVPHNLDHNPFNAEITNVSFGDIRGHYKSICNNINTLEGDAFGANNFRDLGNLIPYGTRIIQNSASIVPAAVFFRDKNANILDAIDYNSREYIKFKSLLLDTVDKKDYNVLQDDATILDEALADIASIKVQSNPFFWSDMIPSKEPTITKTYSFKLGISSSSFPLSRVYTFTEATYYSVLVYVTRKVGYQYRTVQLIKGFDYTVSPTDKRVTVTYDLVDNDVLTVKEYYQTYGSFVPNTPTKLGLYPAFNPEVILDDTYSKPTYFIKGHDGSYNKLYGEYVDGYLEDFRDRALLEFEKRIYNNLKVDAKIPVEYDDIFPGQFRTTEYNTQDLNTIYSINFLNWIGLNRVDYQTQNFVSTNEFTWNYRGAQSKLLTTIQQGSYRGMYLWFYDTATPNITPWEMVGLYTKPSWWEARYGEAPYTSDNKLLWENMRDGYVWNDGKPYINEKRVRPDLLKILPVDIKGNLLAPFSCAVNGYNPEDFRNEWVVGDVGPTEYSYRKSSSWPFDLMRMIALAKPAAFFTLGLDLDVYKYDEEFKQYLVYNRTRGLLDPSQLYFYGANDTAVAHSYINWVVDYLNQYGVDGADTVRNMIINTDVRLTYRLAGFSDKDMLKFFLEKGSPESKYSSLMIPDENYAILLYENEAVDTIQFSSVIVQKTENGYKVYGNSQSKAYFVIANPISNGNLQTITVNTTLVKIYTNFSEDKTVIPYGTEFKSLTDLCNFIAAYGKHLSNQGVTFNDIENGLELNWNQMIAELLYWVQTGWDVGSTVNVNPCANKFSVEKENLLVQPLTIERQNFVLNQNLLPIKIKDLAITRQNTMFGVKALNQGDSISYITARLSNIEHLVVFDNQTSFNDLIFNLVSGLRQQRIFVKGVKTAEWDGTIDAAGFILNQDNIKEWKANEKYTKGVIVKYKNKYWISQKVISPTNVFDTNDWLVTDYDKIQKGLLPNANNRALESTFYYDINRSNLESDGDLLSFSLIGYRPRQYLVDADLDDTTQVNVYRNMIGVKGTNIAAVGLNNLQVQQNTINYTIHENWAIKSSEFGGILNQNFTEITLDQNKLVGNPSVVSIVVDSDIEGSEQQVPLYNIKNYGRALTSNNILPTINNSDTKLPNAGYVNFNDIRAAGYSVSKLNDAIIYDVYKGEYIWIADEVGTWNVYSMTAMENNLVSVVNNMNGYVTFTFKKQHGFYNYQHLGILNFNSDIDGYYTVNSVLDLYSLVVELDLPPSITTLTGLGMVMKFQYQRVGTGRDIEALPIIYNENYPYKVWVDKNTESQWAVYERDSRYQEETTFNKLVVGSSNYGSGMTYVPSIEGYFVSDYGQQKMYHYTKVEGNFYLLNTFTSDGTVSTRYGTFIAASDKFLVVSDSDPTAPYDDSNSYLFIYRIVNTPNVQGLVLDQVEAVGGSDLGESMAFSGDGNLLYVNLPYYGIVAPFQLDLDYVYADVGLTLASATVVGANTFTVTGNKVDTLDAGKYIAFDNGGYEQVYTVITGTYNATANITTFYIEDSFDYTYTSGSKVYTASAHFSIIEVNINGTLYPELLMLDSGSAAAKYGYSVATNYDGSKLFIGAPKLDLSSSYQDTGAVFCLDRLVVTIEVQYDGRPGTFALLNLPWNPTSTSMVYVNGVRQKPGNYILLLNVLILGGALLRAGDLVTISSGNMVTAQELVAYESIGDVFTGEQFGFSLACNDTGSELIVGSPYNKHLTTGEGAVYRFTNQGKAYGMIVALLPANITDPDTYIMLNGFSIPIKQGDNAASIANRITYEYRPTNIFAYATEDSRLVIRLRDYTLGKPNDKLVLTVFNGNIMYQMGIAEYTKTQILTEPHGGKGLFGYAVAFNEHNSIAISAPQSTRYLHTKFDYSFNSNYHDDTVFDNNFTQFIDERLNAGTVYMYDYMFTYEETLLNQGKFLYAQSCNGLGSYPNQIYNYGKTLAFKDYTLMIGDPTYNYNSVGGRVWIFENSERKPDWSIVRTFSDVVDINKIQKVQLYDNINNTSLQPLDYFDPLQGKLLGAVRKNIDFIGSADPAGYNSSSAFNGSIVWGEEKIGTIWFDISSVKFVNYHQGDVNYDSKYWGTVFPGSEVSIYSWVESDMLPETYTGTGTVYDTQKYAFRYELDANGNATPKYYYWVKDTNIVFSKQGKTLSDLIIRGYIENPQSSGISYFAPIKPSTFALYNCNDLINSNQTNLYIGYSSGSGQTVPHQEFKLIRNNYPEDFLPGLPTSLATTPASLYDKLIDSLAGTDELGAVVPDPALPKLLQIGISVRPRQSFFLDRFKALENYLTYANQIMALYPIAEFGNATFLNATGEYYDTPSYWVYKYWWAEGYSNSTKTSFEVSVYSDLETITPKENLIVGVTDNGNNKREVYIYQNSAWSRIGLQDGTIEFLDSLWDYKKNKIGFGDNYFDSVPYDQYPTIETRYIVRALNEQIYTGSLLEYRNDSLTLLFEYIQSENIESNNYMPWLNKTSFIDVIYKVRDLVPYEKYRQDNENLLEGFINEMKPYHVVIKEFNLKYTGTDVYEAGYTDFDLPAQYNPSLRKFISPQLVNSTENNETTFLSTSDIWKQQNYISWFNNYGLTFEGSTNNTVAVITKYLSNSDIVLYVDNARGMPAQGVFKVGDELIAYTGIDRDKSKIFGLSRGIDNTLPAEHRVGTELIMDLPGVIVLHTGRKYTSLPNVTAYIDTNIYPAPKTTALLKAVVSNEEVIGVQVINQGSGYAVEPTIIIDSSFKVNFQITEVNFIENTINIQSDAFVAGDLVKVEYEGNQGIIAKGYHYLGILSTFEPMLLTFSPTARSIITLHKTREDALSGQNRITFFTGYSWNDITYKIGVCALAVPNLAGNKVRTLQDTLRFDRTSYQSKLIEWNSGEFWASPYISLGNDSSSNTSLYDATTATIQTYTVSPSGGTGASFKVYNVMLGEQYIVEVVNGGTGFNVNDIVTISGITLGGVDPTYTTTATTTTGSFNVTVSSATGIQLNDYVVGFGIPAGTKVIHKSGTTIKLSKAATVTGSTPFLGKAGSYPNNCLIKVTGTSSGAITSVSYAGASTDAWLASFQGAVMPVLSATSDSSGNALVSLNFGPSGLQPGQLKGVKVFFYHNKLPYIYDDSSANGAIIEIYQPKFSLTNTTNEYTFKIISPGTIYNDGDKITIPGASLFGGITGKNDAVITINYVSPSGGIYLATISGLSTINVKPYYMLPHDAEYMQVYSDPGLLVPVKFSDFEFDGLTYSDYGYSPEPLTAGINYKFDLTSYTVYNNKIYRCVESNNDSVFDSNKWALVDSSDRAINALDRIVAYYQPTIDMPGKDLKQLLSGVTYPNNIYMDNPFAPDEQLTLDIELRDIRYYPDNITITSIVYDGSKYVAVGDDNDKSYILVSTDYGDSWDFRDLSTTPLGITGITYYNNEYIITTKNTATPVFISTDTINWTTIGEYTPFDNLPYGLDAFDGSATRCPAVSLYKPLIQGDNSYLVGQDGILRSDYYNSWSTIYSRYSSLTNIIYDIEFAVGNNFEMFIAVGRADTVVSGLGTSTPTIAANSSIVTSLDGLIWTEQTPVLANRILYTVTYSSDVIVIAGEKGTIYHSTNGFNWIPSTISAATVTTPLLSSARGNGKFVIVGTAGVILVSSDGITFTKVSGTTEDLSEVIFDGERFVAVGKNDTIIRSTDGVNWSNIGYIQTTSPDYTIQGDSYESGYGPEELVGGIVSDTLSLKITTAPGAYWDNDIPEQGFWYGYTGFGMNSITVKPDANLQVSFDNLIINPATISVYIVDDTTGLGTRIYQDITSTNNPTSYSVDWYNKVITLNQPITSSKSIRVEVYNLGNGRQIIGTNSQNFPIRTDSNTGNSYFLINSEYKDLVNDPIVMVNGVKLEYNTDYYVTFTPDNLFLIQLNAAYDQYSDYIVFALFADTQTDFNSTQYGYSLPETEVFAGNGTSYVTNLYIDGTNNLNMIVEVNGERLLPTDYTVNTGTGTVTLTSSKTSSDLVAITAYNQTQRQWMSTGTTSTLMVSPITYVYNSTPVKMDIAFVDVTYKYVDGDSVYIAGVNGSTQLNGNVYYVKDVTDYLASPVVYEYELYHDSGLNTAVRGDTISSYAGSGYTWVSSNTYVATSPTVPFPMPDISYTDPLRTWVTINGKRLDNNLLEFGNNNELFILTSVDYGDDILVTAYVTGESSPEMKYSVTVNKDGSTEVYRTNISDTTWLVYDLESTSDTITLNNAEKVIYKETQTVTVVVEDSTVVAYISANLSDIKGTDLFNVTTVSPIDIWSHRIQLFNGRTAIVFFNSSASAGDKIDVTLHLGGVVEINGERIFFGSVDLVNNTLTKLIRGVQGTPTIPHYALDTVIGLNNNVKLYNPSYYKEWNSFVMNPAEGDPLQISTTPEALFLQDNGIGKINN